MSEGAAIIDAIVMSSNGESTLMDDRQCQESYEQIGAYQLDSRIHDADLAVMGALLSLIPATFGAVGWLFLGSPFDWVTTVSVGVLLGCGLELTWQWVNAGCP